MKDLHTWTVLFQGSVRNGLYVLPSNVEDSSTSSPSLSPHMVLIGERTSSQIRHSSLGHPSPRITSLTIQKFHLHVTKKSTTSFCAACSKAKSHALPHPSSPSRSQHPFQLLFLNMWGPVPVLSSNSFLFIFLYIVDKFTKYIWFIPLHAKFDVPTIFLAFICYVSNIFHLM